MQVAITGATGLVGSNLAIELLNQGHTVRCTKRASSKVKHLDDFAIEWVDGDLGDAEGLKRAFDGADAVFHCAALTEVWNRPTPALIRTNVEGTRNVLEAVRACQTPRLVHCSSVVAVGLSEDGQPSNETAVWNFDKYGLDDGYAITKRDSEKLVRQAVSTGLDAVIVNPTYMFGPFDAKPSSGSLIRELVRGRIPGYTTGYNNFVDVRDVCKGMIAAWLKGRQGERYILGNRNLSYHELFDMISQVAGLRTRRQRIPPPLAVLVGYVGELNQLLSGREQRLNRMTVRYSLTDKFIFSSEKAKAELGYAPGTVEKGIEDALKWFKEQKML